MEVERLLGLKVEFDPPINVRQKANGPVGHANRAAKDEKVPCDQDIPALAVMVGKAGLNPARTTAIGPASRAPKAICNRGLVLK